MYVISARMKDGSLRQKKVSPSGLSSLRDQMDAFDPEKVREKKELERQERLRVASQTTPVAAGCGIGAIVTAIVLAMIAAIAAIIAFLESII